MVCPKCKKEVDGSKKFCAYCGASLNVENKMKLSEEIDEKMKEGLEKNEELLKEKTLIEQKENKNEEANIVKEEKKKKYRAIPFIALIISIWPALLTEILALIVGLVDFIVNRKKSKIHYVSILAVVWALFMLIGLMPNTDEKSSGSKVSESPSDGGKIEIGEYIEEIENMHFYEPDTFPYVNKKASEYTALYREALNNRNSWVTVNEKKGFTSSTYVRGNGLLLYYGETKGGKPNGKGMLFGTTSMGYGIVPIYIGEFKKGRFNGYGITFERDGDRCRRVVYEGEFKKGQYNGQGVLYGQYEGGMELYHNYDVKGITLVCATGIKYNGQFKNNHKNGQGTSYLCNFWKENVTQIEYSGNWKNDKFSGKGILYYTIDEAKDKVRYIGEFKVGQYNGKGTVYKTDGSVDYKGKFRLGELR